MVCHSLLPKEDITLLNDSCVELGMQVSKNWSDRVRILVMHQIQMTPKVLLALIDQKDIVTKDFMVALRNRANLHDPIPAPSAAGPLWETLGEGDGQPNARWRNRITGLIQVDGTSARTHERTHTHTHSYVGRAVTRHVTPRCCALLR